MKVKILIQNSILMFTMQFMIVYGQIENVTLESVSNQTFIISQPIIQDSVDFMNYIQLSNTRGNDLDSNKYYNVVITFQDLFNESMLSTLLPGTTNCSGSIYFQDSTGNKSILRLNIDSGNNITFEDLSQIDSSTQFYAFYTSLQGVIIKQLWNDNRILCLDVGPIEYLQTQSNGWIIVTLDLYDLAQQFDPNGFTKSSIGTKGKNIAFVYYLFDNYPNPFNPTTRIEFTIPENQFVTLKVYDILGEEVATLVNEEKEAGYYSIAFDASNLATGIYIYKIKAGDFSQTKKMILMK